VTGQPVCRHCGEPLVGKRRHAEYCDSTCRGDASRLRKELQGDEKALKSAASDGSGSRGGNVRDLDTARDLQAHVKAKRDWSGAIDEQIRLTLLETGYFHADDLDELRIPPEHVQLKGTRSAWFRNQGFMEKTGAERKVSHKAANGRKAAIHRITPKGRQALTVGVGGGSAEALSPSASAAGHSLHPGEQSAPTGAPSPKGSDRATNPPVPSASATNSPAVESPPRLTAGESGQLFELDEARPKAQSAQRNPEAA
jgi:hypothetical protein